MSGIQNEPPRYGVSGRLILYYIDDLDMVTLMAVEPGFSGQPLLPGSMERLEELARLRKIHNAHFLINVDGGISRELERRCAGIGVDVIIGTIHNIFRQPEGLQKACERFEQEWGCPMGITGRPVYKEQ